ncbi:unnamed protein product [Ilex paraguariensis]|uniref:Secreted protein n=1 Tax=Ilex paraguariensis TaxID=185542 RepID=A0ABC8UAN4_9AQUA
MAHCHPKNLGTLGTREKERVTLEIGTGVVCCALSRTVNCASIKQIMPSAAPPTLLLLSLSLSCSTATQADHGDFEQLRFYAGGHLAHCIKLKKLVY